MFKVNNRNTRTRCTTCSKLTIKALERRRLKIEILEQGVENAQKLTINTPERRQWRRSSAFIVNFKLNMLHNLSSVSIVNFEHVIAGWEVV